MTLAAETIDHATLEHLVAAGAVRAASAVAQSGGWGVVVAYGTAVRTLASYLKDMGIAQFEVDARQYDPDKSKATTPRVDAAERMRNAHEAAAYTNWLAKEVQEALDDPRPSGPHAQVTAEWMIERASLAQQVDTTGR